MSSLGVDASAGTPSATGSAASRRAFLGCPYRAGAEAAAGLTGWRHRAVSPAPACSGRVISPPPRRVQVRARPSRSSLRRQSADDGPRYGMATQDVRLTIGRGRRACSNVPAPRHHPLVPRRHRPARRPRFDVLRPRRGGGLPAGPRPRRPAPRSRSSAVSRPRPGPAASAAVARDAEGRGPVSFVRKLELGQTGATASPGSRSSPSDPAAARALWGGLLDLDLQ